MIVERVELHVTEGGEDAFEHAVTRGASLVEGAQGCRSLRLLRSVDRSGGYLLLVEWDTLEDHTERFRGTPSQEQWMTLIAPFLAARPAAEHYALIAD